MLRKDVRTVVFALACISLGGVAGYFTRDFDSMIRVEKMFIEQRTGGYRYINPLLDCETAASYADNRELTPFADDLGDFIAQQKSKQSIEDLSVYFRELNSGSWFSIGDTERFAPASLLKVPLMVAFMKEAERDPSLLSRKVRFQGFADENAMQTIKPIKVLTEGGEYSVEELISRMILYSDNNAKMMLENRVNVMTLAKTYEDLGMANPYRTTNRDVLSAHEYAMFFRALYNATYLSKDSSEKALKLLSQTEFKAGIVAGVPAGTTVAHKFGERLDLDTYVRQLHDCGIVYYPGHPYVLCVMSRGASMEMLASAIATVSKVVYENVERQFRADEGLKRQPQ